MSDDQERNNVPLGKTRNVYQYITTTIDGYLNTAFPAYPVVQPCSLTSGLGAFLGPATGFGLRPDISDDSKIHKRAWSKSAPEWRHAVNGLNLEGDCTNSSCRAYGRRVIIKWGYRNDGLFDFFRNQQDCACPLCASFVDPVNFGFANTYYQVSGYKKDKLDSPYKDVETPWHYAPNCYVTFKEQEEDMVYWGKLEIRVKEDCPPVGDKEVIFV
ncbi:hypothetical protein BDZ91DRAFT_747271 [Kalaharituber pfeilii]|nr:hypothetical protein BDZ91DRAFT_747271 [Kalaharituber pfeilii]